MPQVSFQFVADWFLPDPDEPVEMINPLFASTHHAWQLLVLFARGESVGSSKMPAAVRREYARRVAEHKALIFPPGTQFETPETKRIDQANRELAERRADFATPSANDVKKLLANVPPSAGPTDEEKKRDKLQARTPDGPGDDDTLRSPGHVVNQSQDMMFMDDPPPK